MSRRGEVKSGKIHRSQAGKTSEIIIVVIQCFPLAKHKMHKHAQTTYVLFRLQLSDNLNPGRFCIKMQISSFSGNMRKSSNIASIFLQNDCSLGQQLLIKDAYTLQFAPVPNTPYCPQLGPVSS